MTSELDPILAVVPDDYQPDLEPVERVVAFVESAQVYASASVRYLVLVRQAAIQLAREATHHRQCAEVADNEPLARGAAELEDHARALKTFVDRPITHIMEIVTEALIDEVNLETKKDEEPS